MLCHGRHHLRAAAAAGQIKTDKIHTGGDGVHVCVHECWRDQSSGEIDDAIHPVALRQRGSFMAHPGDPIPVGEQCGGAGIGWGVNPAVDEQQPTHCSSPRLITNR